MSALRGMVAGGALLAVVACSGGGDLDDGPLSGAGPTGTPSVMETTLAPPTTAVPTPTAAAKVGGVTVGKYAEDPAVQSFARYVAVRFTALRRRDARYAPMLALATRSRQAHERALIDRMIADNQVVEGKVRWAVVGAATTGARARVRACQRDDASWFLDRDTGRRTPVKPRWIPFDVRMVRSDGVWKVDSAYEAKFSCGEAR